MTNLDKESLKGITALLIHAAKIDELYSEHEKDIIKNFIKSFSKEENIDNFLFECEKIEENSNQLLSFTNIIKKKSLEIKKEIIESLWKIIISDNSIDQYESNLMRRICGLIYFSDKLSGEIKMSLTLERKKI